MPDTQLLRIRIKPGKTDRVVDFIRSLLARRREALEALEREGMLAESFFLERQEQGDYLYYYVKTEDIRRARVIEPGNRDRVFFGAVVEVLDRNRGKVREYALVGPGELDPDSGRISAASPIGRALIGRRAGETVSNRVPRGGLLLEILGFR